MLNILRVHGYICALIILLLARCCFFLVIVKSLTCESPSVQRSLNLFKNSYGLYTIAGCLFYHPSEYQVQRHTAVSSTSKPNEWLQPRTIKQVPFLRFEDIDFTSAECSMKNYISMQQMCQLQSDQSDNELSQLDSSQTNLCLLLQTILPHQTS